MAKIIPFKNGTIKQTISKKASYLFKERGYNATSMKEIAESIGVEAPSLYNHINSKKEILQEICFKVGRQFTTYINEVAKSSMPVINKLDLVIRFHIQMMLNEHHDVYVAEHEWKHLNEPYLSNFKTQRRNYRNQFAYIIEQGIDNGDLNDIHPSVAVLAILSAINGIEAWHHSRKNIDANSLEETMVEMLLNGMIK